MAICKYGEYPKFLMDETIQDEIDSIIVFAKLLNWKVFYWQKLYFWSRELQIGMPFYDTTHFIRIKISKRSNKAKSITHYAEKWIDHSQVPFTISKINDTCSIKKIDRVFFLLRIFKLSIMKEKK